MGTARSDSDISPSSTHPFRPGNGQRVQTERHSKWTPPNIQATNFQTVRCRMPISGTYVIDPGLEMPADLIHGSPAKKSNLSLECTRGSITADIWLVDEANRAIGVRYTNEGKALFDIHCKSWLGKVNVKVYSLSARPFVLNASSSGGNITVALPPDFVGPITLCTGSLYDSFRPSSFTPFAPSGIRETPPGTPTQSQSGVRTVPYSTSITFSEAVRSRLVTFSEVDGKRTCFMGDYRAAGYTTRKEWSGSMVDIASSYGTLKLTFIDEPKEEQSEESGCVVM